MAIDPNIYSNIQPIRVENPIDQMLKVQSVQALQQQRQEIAAERQAQTQALQQKASDQQAVDQALSGSSSLDDVITKLRTSGHGHLIPQIQTMQDQMSKAQELQDKITSAKTAQEKAELEYGAHLASSVLSYKDQGPDAMLAAFQTAARVATAHGHDVSNLVQAVQQNPAALEPALKGIIAMAQGPQAPKETVVPKDATLVQTGGTNPAGGTVIAQGLAGQPTAADLDAQYQGLLQKVALKQPLTAQEQAAKQAYEQRKLLGPEAAQAFAANQQARAQAQQNALAQRSEDFKEKQAGLAELQNKVEQPYFDAKEKAATLRSTIQAAQNGNMVAGSVQSLLGTLGLVTAEGVKRINTTELQSVQGAGSLLERLKGQVSGLTAGQKLSPKLQGDLQQMADILEKSAADKYSQGWQATVKRYPELKGEQPLVPMGAAPTAGKDPLRDSLMPQTLAQLVRAKYPGQYDDLSDQDLETKVKAKFPGVYDDVPTTPASATKGVTATGDTFADKVKSAAGYLTNALPAVGGAVGGFLGGPGGAAAGGAAGQGYRTLIQHAGEIPGAIADVASNLRTQPMATIQGAVGGTTQGAIQAGTQGAIQGGLTAAGNLVTEGLQRAAPRLMQSALKPTASLVKEYQTTPDALVKTLLDEGVNVTEAGKGKLQVLLNATNDEIKDAIANAPGTISKQVVAARALPTAAKLASQTNPTADLQAVGNTVEDFLNHPVYTGNLTVPEAQAMKIGTYRQIGQSYGELSSAAVETQKALARGLKEEIANEVPQVSGLNQRDAQLMGALDAVGRRVALAGNRDPAGFAWVTAHPATFITALMDRSPAVKSLLARGSYASAAAAGRVSEQLLRAAVQALASSPAPGGGPPQE